MPNVATSSDRFSEARVPLLKAIRSRLAGEVSLGQALFYEMLLIGTMLNIAIGLCAFAMIAADLPIWLPILVFLSPQPYNIVLLMSVWRSATLIPGRGSDMARMVAVLWFVLMIFV